MEIIEKIRDEIKKVISETKIGAITNQRLGNILLMLTDYDLYKKLRQDKGYFASIDALKAQHPYPRTGDVASAGTPYPGYIVRCDIDGYWTQTGERPIAPVYDNADYVHRGGDEVINGKKTFTSPIKSVPGVDGQDVMTVGQYNDKKDVAGGYAGLDAGRHIDASLIPLDYRKSFGYRFDGTSNIDVPSNGILFGENDFSVEVYFRPLVVDALNWIMLKLESRVYWGIFIREDGLVGINTVKDDFVQSPVSKTKLVAGNWYHLMITRQGDKQFIYLNGICETVTGNLMILNVDNKQNLHIGGQNGYEIFKGDVGLIRFYNYSLEQSDIAYYYNGGRPDLRNLRYEDIIDTYDELITDTQFNTPSKWTLGNGWSISDGKLIATNVVNSYTAQWGIGIKRGKKYNIKCDCKNDLNSLGIEGGRQVKISRGNYNVKITTEPNGAVVVHGDYTIPYSDSIDNMSVKQIGCTMELLPDNANPKVWLETQKNQNGVVKGNVIINLDVPATEIQIIEKITSDIALGVATKYIELPMGFAVEKIIIKNTVPLTKIRIATIGTFVEGFTLNFPNAITSIPIVAQQMFDLNYNTLKINASGNSGEGFVLIVYLKKIL